MIGDRWGVSDGEIVRTYPCDDFVTSPTLQAWRGVSIEAPTEAVAMGRTSAARALLVRLDRQPQPPITSRARRTFRTSGRRKVHRRRRAQARPDRLGRTGETADGRHHGRLHVLCARAPGSRHDAPAAQGRHAHQPLGGRRAVHRRSDHGSTAIAQLQAARRAAPALSRERGRERGFLPTTDKGRHPCARGAVPYKAASGTVNLPVVPAPRGCSHRLRHQGTLPRVVPASAGLFPTELIPIRPCPRRPPRMRGCSVPHEPVEGDRRVVPAYARLFLMMSVGRRNRNSRPACAGLIPPRSLHGGCPARRPRTRGCSQWIRVRDRVPLVIPAHAGAVPTSSW